MPTVSETIGIAKVSQFLVGNYIERSGLYSAGIDLRRPRHLYCVRKNVEWMYGLDSSNETLEATHNYLYSICWNSPLAQRMLNISSGGSISPVVPIGSNLPNPYDWIVGSITTADAPLKEGDTTITLDGTNGTRDFRGYNVEFYRGSQPDYTTNPGDGSVYYTWDRVLGIFTLRNGAAQLGEQMRIAPVLGIATETPSTDPTTITHNLTTTTEITYPSNSNLLIQEIIIPNGNSYTWASGFVFSDNWPEQPGATGVNTMQVYTFMKANSSWVCVGQSLNIPI